MANCGHKKEEKQKENQTALIKFRATVKDKMLLQSRAFAVKKSLSAYIKDLLLK